MPGDRSSSVKLFGFEVTNAGLHTYMLRWNRDLFFQCSFLLTIRYRSSERFPRSRERKRSDVVFLRFSAALALEVCISCAQDTEQNAAAAEAAEGEGSTTGAHHFTRARLELGGRLFLLLLRNLAWYWHAWKSQDSRVHCNGAENSIAQLTSANVGTCSTAGRSFLGSE